MKAHMTEWWHDHTVLSALYLWLVDELELDPADSREVAYFLSKPWKWNSEYLRMRGMDTALELKLNASLREVRR